MQQNNQRDGQSDKQSLPSKQKQVNNQAIAQDISSIISSSTNQEEAKIKFIGDKKLQYKQKLKQQQRQS